MAEINGGQIAARQLRAAGIDTVFGVVAGPMIELFARRAGGGPQGRRLPPRAERRLHGLGLGLPEEEAGRAGRRLGPGHDERDHAALRRDRERDAARGARRLRVRRARSASARSRSSTRSRSRSPCASGRARSTAPSASASGSTSRSARRSTAGPAASTSTSPASSSSTQGAEERRVLRSAPELTRPHPDPDAIARTADLLESPPSARCVLIGKGAAWADAGPALARLVDLGIPYVTSPMARGTLPDDHPNFANAARSHALGERRRGRDVRRPLQLDLRPRPPLREGREDRAGRRRAGGDVLGREPHARHRRPTPRSRPSSSRARARGPQAARSARRAGSPGCARQRGEERGGRRRRRSRDDSIPINALPARATR